MRFQAHPFQTLEALNELISAGNVWDSAVNEAILLIESEERRCVLNTVERSSALTSIL